MRIRLDAARILDAEFEIVEAGSDGRFSVVVESAGQTSAGARRNPDYMELVEELTRRASRIDAVLEDAVVASSTVQAHSLANRRLHLSRPYPVELGPNHDFRLLARELTRPQADIGSTRKATSGGNRRKRMQITFRTPAPVSPDDLVELFSAVSVESPATASSATPNATPATPSPGIADQLTAVHFDAALNRLGQGLTASLGPGEGDAVTSRFRVLYEESEFDAARLAIEARTIAGLPIEGPWRLGRADLIIPLRRLGYPVVDPWRPAESPLGGDPTAYTGLAERFGNTDRALQRVGRREQQYLRGALGIGTSYPSSVSECGMCGLRFPQSFLVAAHIKPRHLCSDAERLDLPHVGWALCLFGCDVLFEQGFVHVDDRGRLQTSLSVEDRAALSITDDPVNLRLAELQGRRVPAWCEQRRPYFSAHRLFHETRRGQRPSAQQGQESLAASPHRGA